MSRTSGGALALIAIAYLGYVSLIGLGLSLLLAHEALVRTSPQPLVQPA